MYQEINKKHNKSKTKNITVGTNDVIIVNKIGESFIRITFQRANVYKGLTFLKKSTETIDKYVSKILILMYSMNIDCKPNNVSESVEC